MKYKKKKNCSYKTSKIDYCWGYAQAVDMGLSDEAIERRICKKGCEFYSKEVKSRKGGGKG